VGRDLSHNDDVKTIDAYVKVTSKVIIGDSNVSAYLVKVNYDVIYLVLEEDYK